MLSNFKKSDDDHDDAEETEKWTEMLKLTYIPCILKSLGLKADFAFFFNYLFRKIANVCIIS